MSFHFNFPKLSAPLQLPVLILTDVPSTEGIFQGFHLWRQSAVDFFFSRPRAILKHLHSKRVNLRWCLLESLRLLEFLVEVFALRYILEHNSQLSDGVDTILYLQFLEHDLLSFLIGISSSQQPFGQQACVSCNKYISILEVHE